MELPDVLQQRVCPRCRYGIEYLVDGVKLRMLRLELPVPAAEMARRLGMTRQELHDKETHRQNRRFTEDQARRYLAVLKGGG